MSAKIGKWEVKYRLHNERQWEKLVGEPHYWYADPLLFTWKEKTYLFTEAYDEKKQIGRLAISEYKNGRFTIPEIIIKKPYHLSYPCVFENKGIVYMIPETSQNKTLELYVASESLKHWEKKCTLLKGIQLVDTTIIQEDNKNYLYSYSDFNNQYVSYLFELDLGRLELNLIEKKQRNKNQYRSAGNIFFYKKSKYMPFQNNVSLYGQEILIRKADTIKDILGENVCCDVIPDSLKNQSGIEADITRTHTLSYDDKLEVIDVLREFPDRFAYLKTFYRRLRNLCFKILRRNVLKL